MAEEPIKYFPDPSWFEAERKMKAIREMIADRVWARIVLLDIEEQVDNDAGIGDTNG